MHEITRWSEELGAAYLYRVVAAAEAETGTLRRGRALIQQRFCSPLRRVSSPGPSRWLPVNTIRCARSAKYLNTRLGWNATNSPLIPS